MIITKFVQDVPKSRQNNLQYSIIGINSMIFFSFLHMH
jgi:hypothetical protein